MVVCRVARGVCFRALRYSIAFRAEGLAVRAIRPGIIVFGATMTINANRRWNCVYLKSELFRYHYVPTKRSTGLDGQIYTQTHGRRYRYKKKCVTGARKKEWEWRGCEGVRGEWGGVRKNEAGVFMYTYAWIITTLIMFSQPLSVDFFLRTHARPPA